MRTPRGHGGGRKTPKETWGHQENPRGHGDHLGMWGLEDDPKGPWGLLGTW